MGYNPQYYLEHKEEYAKKSKAWREKNKDRTKENRKRNYEENKERNLEYSRIYNLKRKFNLTPEEYEALLQKQNGVCAICKQTCTKKLAVDHDHATGVVRGLLCNNCNRGIGHLKDNIQYLENAIKYLNPR